MLSRVAQAIVSSGLRFTGDQFAGDKNRSPALQGFRETGE